MPAPELIAWLEGAECDAWESLFAAAPAPLAPGVTDFVTETGVPLPGEPHPSYANIRRAGFHMAYERPSWASEAQSTPGESGHRFRRPTCSK